MTLTVRTGTALRWRPTLSACITDLIRVHVDANGVVLALLANGFDSGFSTCWPTGSRLVLDIFVDAWTSSSGSTSSRLASSVGRSREQFVTAVPNLVGAQNIDIDPPGATLLAVAVEGARSHAAWIGGDKALLARGFEAVGRTTPHTLLEQFKREHPEQAHNLDAFPNAVVRSFGPHANKDLPDVAVFDAQAGDTLLLVSKAALSGPCLAPEEAAFAAAAYASPEALAERLTDVAFRNESTPFAAVVALRFDAVDVSAELDRLIAAYEADPRHGAWLGAWARTERALPVSFDMGGVVGLRRDGSVVSVAWDDPGSTREDTSDAAQLAATIGASRNYPALRTLAPARPPHAKACPHCAKFRVTPGGAEGCPMCWYLGWVPPNPPPWFLRSDNGTRR